MKKIILLLVLAFYILTSIAVFPVNAQEKYDELSDVRDLLSNSVILEVDSYFALVNGTRVKFDENNDNIMVKKLDNYIYVPASFAETVLNVESKPIEIDGIYYVNAKDIKNVYISRDEFVIIADNHLEIEANLERFSHFFGLYVVNSTNLSRRKSSIQVIQSIDEAKNLVKTIKLQYGLPKGGIVVFLYGGEYRLKDTVNFSETDSGMIQAPITYAALPGEKVTIMGGDTIPVDRFKSVTDKDILKRVPAEARNKISYVDLKKLGIRNYGDVGRIGTNWMEANSGTELFIDDHPATIARWPNINYATTGEVVMQGQNGATPIAFVFDNPRLDRWTTAPDAWMYGFWTWNWADENLPIGEIDADKRIITSGIGHGYGLSNARRWYIYNLLEELDLEYEWYLDRKSGYLYVMLPKDAKNVQISVFTKPLVVLDKTSHLTFERLNFSLTNNSAIIMQNESNENKVLGCTFRNIGKQGVVIDTGDKNLVQSSDFFDIGKGGVYIKKSGDVNTITHGENKIDNNRFIRNDRLSKTNSPAIYTRGTGDVFSHNMIYDFLHSGIMYFDAPDNIFEYNEIFYVCNATDDAGGIYTGRDFRVAGNTIRYNYMHDMKSEKIGNIGSQAIYYDDLSAGMASYGNVIYNVDNPIMNNGGRENNFDNNIIIDTNGWGWFNDGHTTFLNVGGTIWERLQTIPYKSEPWASRFPWMSTYLDTENFMRPSNSSAKNNLYVNGGNDFTQPVAELAKPYYDFSNNQHFKTDPGFEDMSIKNFQLKEDFVVYKNNPDFKPVPFEKMGLYYDRYRTKTPEINDVNLVAPYDKQMNVEANAVDFVWKKTDDATNYRLTIAKDRDFKNIVYDEFTRESMVHLGIFKYDQTRYYWKVQAYGDCKSYGYDVISSPDPVVRSFTTAKAEYIDFTDYDNILAQAKEALNSGAIEGDGPGQQVPGSTESLKEFINQAEKNKSSITTSKKLALATKKLEAAKAAYIGAKNPETITINDWLDNTKGWDYQLGVGKFSGSTFEFKAINGQHRCVAAYTAKKLENYQRIKFNSIMYLDDGGWRAMQIRTSKPQDLPFGSNTDYLVVVKDTQIELQRFTEAEGGTKYITDVPNDGIIVSGQKHLIEYGAVNEGSAVRVTFVVDGKTIFDYLDEDNPILSDGYFAITNIGIAGSGRGEIHLLPVEE